MEGLIWAAVAPHGDLAIEEAGDEASRHQAWRTRASMRELEGRLDTAQPDSVVVLTPHGVHVEGAMAVVVAGRTAGRLEGADHIVELQASCDRDLAEILVGQLRRVVPCARVSFGGNAPAEAVMPMDWGALVPLWYLGARRPAPLPVVLVSPCRDLGPGDHVEAGRAIARAAMVSGKRVALVASADHGHAHRVEGPYGYDPAAAEYDATMCRILSEGRLEALAELDPEFVARARADSWWQLLMLSGATRGWRCELLSYEVPTYFGMICCALSPDQ